MMSNRVLLAAKNVYHVQHEFGWLCAMLQAPLGLVLREQYTDELQREAPTIHAG